MLPHLYSAIIPSRRRRPAGDPPPPFSSFVSGGSCAELSHWQLAQDLPRRSCSFERYSNSCSRQIGQHVNLNNELGDARRLIHVKDTLRLCISPLRPLLQQALAISLLLVLSNRPSTVSQSQPERRSKPDLLGSRSIAPPWLRPRFPSTIPMAGTGRGMKWRQQRLMRFDFLGSPRRSRTSRSMPVPSR